MLSGAGVFEIVRAVAMKYPQGFSQPVPSVITAAACILSAVFERTAFRFRLCHAGGVRHNRYSFFRSHVFYERLSVMQVVSPVLIIAGVAGLKLFAESD